ncbi:MAG TPA: alanine dehydrogenase [Phycisphaerae bacterium]|nr:alanine dehydrogenase [Phycisphaerae bacterium]HPM23901.1 alanine dehydrogenase [Phycisphaerae bacterium]
MIIGVPKEVKPDEYRVAVVPAGVEQLKRGGHTVVIERGAGVGSGLADADYEAYGAEMVSSAAEVWARAELICKVKEPLAQEIPMIRKGQVVFTYFHFAASRQLTEGVRDSGCVAIAYETIHDREGRLPLLAPMSEVAGKMSIQEGAKYLEKPMEGRGILLGGIPGVEPANVLVLGGGIVGTNAAKLAAGLGANVTIMDIDLYRLRYLDDVMPANVSTVYSTPEAIRRHLETSDLVIGAVLIPGARCPMLVRRENLKLMRPGAVIVDVGVDQGGCCETTHPTTHGDPTYVIDGVVHYGVANMPGAVGRTSTFGLTNATIPYLVKLANGGYEKACAADPGLAAGVNMVGGKITNRPVAEAFGFRYEEFKPR